MSARLILLAGWEGAVPDLGGLTIRSVPAAQVCRLLRPREASFVVALGDRAVRALDPEGFLLALRRTLALAVLCPSESLRPCAGSWRGIAPLAEARGDGLYGALFEAAHTPLRMPVPRSEWLPRAAGGDPFLGVFAGVVEACDRPSVKEAAARMGRSRFQLDRDCWKRCGVGPRCLIRRYIVRSFRAERAAGRTLRQATVSLGYSDRSSLLRALRKEAAPKPLAPA